MYYFCKNTKFPVILFDFFQLLTIICGFHWPDTLFASFCSTDYAKFTFMLKILLMPQPLPITLWIYQYSSLQKIGGKSMTNRPFFRKAHIIIKSEAEPHLRHRLCLSAQAMSKAFDDSSLSRPLSLALDKFSS